MFKVAFSSASLEKINQYIDSYTSYYEDTFMDCWIWSEIKIINTYKREGVFRYHEILEIINKKFGSSLPSSYQDNEVVIKWRSKKLLVSFTENQGTRIITKLEIK